MKKELFLKAAVLLVFLLTSVCATLDTQLFVYPSLSRYLLLEVGAIAIITVGFFVSLCDKGPVSVTGCQLLVLAWVGYIALHGLAVCACELYRTVYLCVTLILILALAYMQRGRWLSRSSVEMVLMAVAVLNAFCVIFQTVGVLPSGSSYFEATGCNENPTVTALYLVGCLPVVAVRSKEPRHRLAYVMLLAALVACVVLLRCRTAYIGLAVEVAVLLGLRLRQAVVRGSVSTFWLGVAGIALLVLAFAAGAKMYNMKKDSADGRVLIWKLSAGMVADRPQGHGYGLFEKYYNLRQADYFADGHYTETEKNNATFVYMPYNDYLEQGVEGGIVGMLFLIAFYSVMVWKAVQAKDHASAAVLLAFAVMSLFNFVYTSILPWLLLVCHASFVVAAEKEIQLCRCSRRFVCVAMLVPVAFIAFKVSEMTAAQLMLGRMVGMAQDGSHIDDGQFERLAVMAGTSEAFWTKRADNNIGVSHFEEALEDIRMARAYSSSPRLFMMEYRCRRNMGEADVAAASLDTLSYMLPRSLTVKHLLMRHYANKHQIREALHYANDILSTGFKVRSERALFITDQARNFKERFGHE